MDRVWRTLRYNGNLIFRSSLDEFSMSAVSIPRVKKVIRSLTYAEAKDVAEKALSLEKPEEIKELVNSFLANIND